MQKWIICFGLLFPILTFSQANLSTKIGQSNIQEVLLPLYTKDSTANALVLFEQANTYMDESKNYNMRTDFYYRIKIFNKQGFDWATHRITLYGKEAAIDIKGITYTLENNTLQKTYLLEKDIFTTDVNSKYKRTSFTMPNIQEGCVIEFQYSVINPYSKIDDWYFQDDIPKLKSEYKAAIVGNYKYNVKLNGFLQLSTNESKIKKGCIHIDGLGEGDCVVYDFAMTDIPAFEEEDYMLSKKNYLSRLSFDLVSFTDTQGIVKNYTKTWKDADFTLKSQYFDNQTSKTNFFKKNIPQDILNTTDALEKGKNVYHFIQQHFTWNERYWSIDDENIKDAFQERTGSVAEINLALFNALKAAELDVELAILSTRQNGIPSKIYPIVNDFNYCIVKLVVNNMPYYLDATNKFLSFGQTPLHTLNGDIRVLNFSKDAEWEKIYSEIVNYTNVNLNLNLDEKGIITGNVNFVKSGYDALYAREESYNKNKDAISREFENRHPFLIVNKYTDEKLEEINEPFKQNYAIEVELNSGLDGFTSINPFLFKFISKNPFKLKERSYPVDFGYTRKYNVSIQITAPEGYTFTDMPAKVGMKMPNNGGIYLYNYNVDANILKMYTRLAINKTIYGADEYEALKTFFNELLKTENSFIKITKNKE